MNLALQYIGLAVGLAIAASLLKFAYALLRGPVYWRADRGGEKGKQ